MLFYCDMSSLNLDSEEPVAERTVGKSLAVIFGSLAFSFFISFLTVRQYMPPAARIGYAVGQTIITALIFGVAFLIIWAIKRRDWQFAYGVTAFIIVTALHFNACLEFIK